MAIISRTELLGKTVNTVGWLPQEALSFVAYLFCADLLTVGAPQGRTPEATHERTNPHPALQPSVPYLAQRTLRRPSQS